MRALTDLTADYVRRLLDYDPTTGALTWKTNADCFARVAGKPAGRLRQGGYRAVKINGREYAAHRLAWVHATGAWPPAQIDHIDRDPSNNALSNLRPATQAENLANTPARANNTSGFKGVSPRRGKWLAQIRRHGKIVYLGSFDTPQEAGAAYLRAAREMHGEFVPSDLEAA